MILSDQEMEDVLEALEEAFSARFPKDDRSERWSYLIEKIKYGRHKPVGDKI